MLPEIQYFKNKMEEQTLVQDRIPSREHLAEWTKIAMGTLSMREFAAKTGLNQTFLSRLCNCKINRSLTIEEIYMIALNNNADKEEVINKQLASPPENVIMDADDIIMTEMLFYNGTDWVKRFKYNELPEQVEWLRKTQELDNIVNLGNILAYNLLNSGHIVSQIRGDSTTEEKHELLDITDKFGGVMYYISDTNPRFHWYDFFDVSEYTGFDEGGFNALANSEIKDKYDIRTLGKVQFFLEKYAKIFMNDYINPNYLSISSYSFIFKDEKLFNALFDLLEPKSYNNSFSLILISPRKNVVDIKKEVLLRRADGLQQEAVFTIR